MHDDQDELRRRIERIEQTATDLAMMLRENTLMIARLNDTLAEFKAEIIKVHAIEKDLSNLAFGFSALKWLATAIGGSAVVLIMAYLFKGQAI
ncbi:hypothetical protein EDC35_10447 [Thiobaca trueperi]|uniref:Uncharacterized protein n=2 Tax=Thiobaca trueperi TaxID=127458 RepID=A0A4R3MXU0_9GAMM|nr:hypothetical protein EDC35_10447 [Thiobaca trueperi]